MFIPFLKSRVWVMSGRDRKGLEPSHQVMRGEKRACLWLLITLIWTDLMADLVAPCISAAPSARDHHSSPESLRSGKPCPLVPEGFWEGGLYGSVSLKDCVDWSRGQATRGALYIPVRIRARLLLGWFGVCVWVSGARVALSFSTALLLDLIHHSKCVLIVCRAAEFPSLPEAVGHWEPCSS